MAREIVVNTSKGTVRVCQIDNDGDGNPRYVIHYLTLFKEYDGNDLKALKLKKYRGKWFGGGYWFYFVGDDNQLERHIEELIQKAEGN